MNDLPELYILFYLAVLSATGLIPITTKKNRLYIHFQYTVDFSYFPYFPIFVKNIVYVTEPPHKQFPAGFLQDFF